MDMMTARSSWRPDSDSGDAAVVGNDDGDESKVDGGETGEGEGEAIESPPVVFCATADRESSLAMATAFQSRMRSSKKRLALRVFQDMISNCASRRHSARENEFGCFPFPR